MTEEEFELKLKERISTVLETEQEEFTSESWVNFEKRLIHFQNKKRFFYVAKIAAAILIFIAGGISVLLINSNYSDEAKHTALYENNKSGKTSDALKDDDIRNDELFTKHEQKVADKNNNLKQSPHESKIGLIQDSKPAVERNNNISLAGNNTLLKNGADTLVSTKNTIVNAEPILQAADSLQSPADIKSIVLQNLPGDAYELAQSIQTGKTLNSLIRFGANVSSIVNYDQANNSSKLNIGGGIFVEIRLVDNFVIYSGLLLTNQSINFQHVTEHTLALGKHVKSKDLKLTGFDIPINLKYRFGIAGTRMFLAAGVSSLTFVKENIETKYEVNSTVATLSGGGLTVMQTVSKEVVETNSLGSFNEFFFAKVLNLSFGVELPLNTRNVLLIEPYLKYSAGPLKSVKAYPSMLGINLGIIF